MKKPLNRWMLLHLALIVLGYAILAFDIFVLAKQEGEELTLAPLVFVLGCGTVVAGILGLLIQSIIHLLAARKQPIQPPVPTRGNGP